MSSDDEGIKIAAALIILAATPIAVTPTPKTTMLKRRKRRLWTRTFYRNRKEYGVNSILRDLRMDESSGQLTNFLRMSDADFEFLLNRITPLIKKQDTHLRSSISPMERMVITLRLLATGDSLNHLSYLSRVSPPAISYIVIDVCTAIIQTLFGEIQMPNTPDGWLKIAQNFEKDTRFPHCIGALDGRHIVLQNPYHDDSTHINYKGPFSIVLMAMCDSDYCFTYADIGTQGRVSDNDVFNNCSLAQKVDSCTLNLPLEVPLASEREKCVPYVIVANNAFTMKKNVMIPYVGFKNSECNSAEQIFNHRLSAARSRIENTFGIMASVFRILQKPMLLQPDKARIIIECCVLLHNFLRRSRTSQGTYTSAGTFDTIVQGLNEEDANWRNGSEKWTSCWPLKETGSRSCKDAKDVRTEFVDFFLSERKVLCA